MSLTSLVAVVVFSFCDPSGYWETVFQSPLRSAGGWKETAKILWYFRGDGLLIIVAVSTMTVAYRRRSLLPVIWTCAAMLSVLSLRRTYTHYWLHLLPAASILPGLAVDGLASKMKQSEARRVIRGAVVGVFLFFAGNIALTFAGLPSQRLKTQPLREVVARLRRFSHGNSFYAIGDGGTFIASQCRLRPAEKYSFFIHLRSNWSKQLPEPLADVLDRLRSAPPDVLAIASDWLPASETPRPIGKESGDEDLRDLIRFWMSSDLYQRSELVGSWTIFSRDAGGM